MKTHSFPNESFRRAKLLPIGISLISVLGSPSRISAQTWTDGTGTGRWADTGNWSTPGFPDSRGANVEIAQDISSPQTVVLDRKVDLNRLTVGDSAAPNSGYTINGASGGTLNFLRSTGNADPAIISQNGPNVITADVRADLSRVTISNTGGGSLSLSGISRGDGGVFRFSDAGTTVAPGGGLISTNGIANVFSTYNGTDWATYDSVTGAVGRFTGYSTLAAATAASNANVTGNATLASSKTINSLQVVSITGGQALNLGANDLTVSSGGILRNGGNHNYSINGAGALRTGAGNELVVHNNSTNQLAINARVVADGITVNSANRIIFANAGNEYGTGSINIVRGFTRFNNATDFANDFNIAATNPASATQSSMELNNNGVTRFNGNFQLNGTLDSVGNNTPAAEFGAGKTLGGIGESRVNSTVFGAIAPGDDGRNGTLRFTKELIFAPGSSLVLDIGDNGLSYNGATYDRVSQTGTGGMVQISEGVGLDLILRDGAELDPLESYFLLTRADSGTYGSTFTGKGEGATFQVGNFLTDITYLANWTGTFATSTLTGGNDVALYNIRAIPEPSGASLACLGALGLLLRRRRI